MFACASATEVNCGFARVAIRELTPYRMRRGSSACTSDRSKREQQFKELFDIPSFNLPDKFFDPQNEYKPSIFNKRCNQTLEAISKKWPREGDKEQYFAIFSTDNWKALESTERHKHTLSECLECHTKYLEYQQLYPAKPVFAPESAIIIPPNPAFSEKENAKRVLTDVNNAWEEKYGHSFTDALPKLCPESQLVPKKSKLQHKNDNRKRDRRQVKHIEKQMGEKATLVMLATGESMAQYHRKRMAMSFECSAARPSKAKRHSPCDENCMWDTNEVLTDLRQWPPGVRINWSKFARDHNIQGKNGGQIVKEFAQRQGINTFLLDQRSDTPRSRPKRYKLIGQEISSPSLPTIESVLKERDQMISDGQLNVGEPCAPFTITRFRITAAGTLHEQQITVEGRKISLLDTRKQLLRQQEKYMHLLSDEQLEQLSEEEIKQTLHDYQIETEGDDNLSLSDLRMLLAKSQRTRTLAIWHDHATILGTGYVLVTVNTIYDPAVHMSEEQYTCKTGKVVKCVRIQQLVEEPLIHIIAAGTSSIQDQASLIPDRVDCLEDLSQPLVSSNGVVVKDILRFFKGDTPAQSFERGTQSGGNYKCGGCGCHSSMMEDLSHALQCKWRPLAELQALVLTSKHGKQPGVLKPFEQLNAEQLQEELRARNVYHTGKTKKDLSEILKETLRGSQRVPTLLLLNPTQSLESLHLQHYTILDSEPLHDIKGHLANLFTELPYVLEGSVRDTCQRIIDSNLKKEKVKGADLRLTAVQVYLYLLANHDESSQVLLLLQTAVQISEILYLPASKRTPKRVLQLYNVVWLHHTLCSLVFSQTKIITRLKLFGAYLHHLSSHAPTQYEIIPLSSVNAECEERLFGQANQIATNASNRHQDNAILNILVRLQAKQLLGEVTVAVQKQEGRISQAAIHAPKYPGTRIAKSFIRSHLRSWQAHLNRISPFLIPGEGIWWRQDADSYIFQDSMHDFEYHSDGPKLLHFRNTRLEDVAFRHDTCWQQILTNNIELPTPQIRLFNHEGDPTGILTYPRPTNSVNDCLLPTNPTTPLQSTPTSIEPSNLPILDLLHLTPTTSENCTPTNPPSCHNQFLLQPTPTTSGSLDAFSSIESITDVVEPVQPTSTGALSELTTCESPIMPVTPVTTITPLTRTPLTTTAVCATPHVSRPELRPKRRLVNHVTNCTVLEEEEDNDDRRLESAQLDHLIADRTTPAQFSTKFATAIAKAIGSSNDLKSYDNKREALKTLKSQGKQLTKEQIESHDKLGVVLQTQVLRKKSELKGSIKQFELEFYQQNHKLPNACNNEHYNSLLRKLKYVKWLLSMWKITL